jgi:anti-sigma regulatory factor (Ser/Thr protein kinase)
VLEIEPAAPLGALAYGTCQEHEVILEPGDTLVLYTDGLVERRTVPLTESIGLLTAALSDAASPAEACRFAVEELVPAEGLRDDVAIVALQTATVPAELRETLPANPQILADLRRLLRRWLRAQGAGDNDIAEIILAVNEACTNAIEHAYSPAPASFELSASADEGDVTVTVRDNGRWREPRGVNRGRGLTIIRAAMDEVQIESGATGTEVVMHRAIAR